MENKDIRWKQRFSNYQNAFVRLKEAVEKFEQLDTLSKEGLIQRFEYTLELAWKTLKDYLESKGDLVKFPRDVIKKAFQTNLIDNGETWLEMLEKRNIMSHTYDEETFNEVLDVIIKHYFKELKALHQFFIDEQ